MAKDCIDEELIERHSGNGESAERTKILAMEEAWIFVWRMKDKKHKKKIFIFFFCFPPPHNLRLEILRRSLDA